MTKTLFAILALAALMWMPRARADDATGLAGKWHIILDTEGGDREANVLFVVDGEKVSGQWDVDGPKAGGTPLAGTLTGKALTLEFPLDSPEVGPGTMKIKGQVADDGTMSGTWSFQDYSGSYKAARVKADDAK